MKILNQQEKQEIIKKLNEQFGIKKFPEKLIKFGQEKIFAFSGDISEKEIKKLQELAHIEGIGVYFAKEQGNQIRLTIEGTHLLKDQIIKNIFELNKEQVEQWMHGSELQVKSGKHGFVVMKYKEDFLGCGKASENKITNFIPKSRRLKEKN